MVAHSLAELDTFMMNALSYTVSQAGEFDILHVENVVSKTAFAKFRDCARKMFERPDGTRIAKAKAPAPRHSTHESLSLVTDGTCLPAVVFHGTPTQHNVESIARDGILCKRKMRKIRESEKF
jgi:hypothetical protein